MDCTHHLLKGHESKCKFQHYLDPTAPLPFVLVVLVVSKKPINKQLFNIFKNFVCC